ncbi:hypothetical protein CHUAL_002020 [Chamberlinius hualienensis]
MAAIKLPFGNGREGIRPYLKWELWLSLKKITSGLQASATIKENTLHTQPPPDDDRKKYNYVISGHLISKSTFDWNRVD